MRLIDADALRQKFTRQHILPNGIQAGIDQYALRCIDESPTIEERKTGKWIENEMTMGGMTSSIPYEYDGCWIIVTDGKNVSVERIKKDAQDHFFPNGRWFELEDVVAWMSLPEPFNVRMEDSDED